MTVIGYIAFIFFALRFMVAAVNVVFSPVIKRRSKPERPLISVLIPARNEEKNILNILTDLKNQNYSNIEVIVFNDQSTDKTRELATMFTKADKRFRLIDSEGLPQGWLGKNHACHKLALGAKGEWILFLDADVRVKSGLFESALSEMELHGLKLLSIFPQQIMVTRGEKMTVPVMNSILLTLLPMILTRISSHPSLAAANGQFMMFEKSTYLNLKPHEAVKNFQTEDIAIARLYKSKQQKMECLTGDDTIRCRMYREFNDAVEGFSRNMAEFFGGSHLAALFYWIMGTFGIFPVIFSLSPELSMVTILLIIGIKISVSYTSMQSSIQNIVFAIPQQAVMGWILFLSVKNKILKKGQWKGRSIG
ncbi:MAG: glycosyltransferase family 2 protein [Prolixibacteraceae bacterium]|nr:glycosyltransferase family 2 protein [Prolixibacteraceae bacterium]